MTMSTKFEGYTPADSLEILDKGRTNTPPLNISSSPEERRKALEISAEVSAMLNTQYEERVASLANKEVVALKTDDVVAEFEKVLEVTQRTVEEAKKVQLTNEEHTLIAGIAQEIEDQKRLRSGVIRVERKYDGKELVVIVDKYNAAQHIDKSEKGKLGFTQKWGKYAVVGKDFTQEMIEKIFTWLPEVKIGNAFKSEAKVTAPLPKESLKPKSKGGFLARIFSCFFCCFGSRK